jgi:1,4-alpha-glucan branching enzyme
MSEFGGDKQFWGYSTSHYFAIEYSGGGRDKYKVFIRECHRRGIAVIMDVVYNHYVHDATRAQWLFDSNAHDRNIYYWYEGTPFHYPDYERFAHESAEQGRSDGPQIGHGGYVDNLSTGFAPAYHEEMVRKLFISSAVTLMVEFHIDGFRVDQTTSIHAYNVRHADGQPVPNANIFGAKFLREWTRTLKLINPDVILTAEDHSNWDKVTEPSDAGGLGFDATWCADFYHHLVGDAADRGPEYARLLKVVGTGYDGPLAMDAMARMLALSAKRKVVYHESHDEAGNGEGTARTIVVAANGSPPEGETRRYAEARCKVVAGISLLSAGTPMFLFGEEVGAPEPFLYNKILEHRIDLKGRRASNGKHLFQYYSKLIRLRRAHPALRSRNIQVVHVHNENRVIAWFRWTDLEEFLVVVSLRNAPLAGPYEIASPTIRDTSWTEVLNSDSPEYGGGGAHLNFASLSSGQGRLGAILPTNGLVVLRRVSAASQGFP